MNAEELLTPVEVGQMTRTPVTTLAWWRHVGSGPRSFKLGAKRVMYRRSDVEKWLEEQYEAEAV